jgi:hypothetical protein
MSIPYKVFKKKIRVEKILSNSFFWGQHYFDI